MNDEPIYEAIAHEIEAGSIRKGLWTMALAQSSGDHDKTVALYIQLRHKQISDEIAAHVNAENERHIEHLKVLDLEQRQKLHRLLDERKARMESYGESVMRHLKFARTLRTIGLPFDTVKLQLQSKGITDRQASDLASSVFGIVGDA